MQMKKILVILTIFVIALTIVGCSDKPENNIIETIETIETKVDLETESSNISPNLTTSQAAQMAYERATSWHEDAVLWYMTPIGQYLSEAWENDDSSSKWAILFVNDADEKRYNVTIEEGIIISSTEEKHTVREIDIPIQTSVNRPNLSMKAAAEICHANNMPKQIKPMIVYTVESAYSKFRGQPIWEFTFGNNKGEFYTYTVDDLNGTLIEIRNIDGDVIEPSDVTP